jgi:hypothetical protein
MKKARITSPSTMSEDQVSEDISMTPLQRLELAFKISDFAADLRSTAPEATKEKSTSIQWIELHKVTAHR